MTDDTARAEALREAAAALLTALDHQRDALNGDGHPGEDHDRLLHMEPCTALPGVQHVYSEVDDCSACGGAQYGSDYVVNGAMGDLRVALGGERRGWEFAS